MTTLLHTSKSLEIHTALTDTKVILPLAESPISAGFPSPADDFIETGIDLNKELIKHQAATFLGRVTGQSMIGLGTETLSEKPSFKSSLNNRCLIYADGFYEWQWLDPKGKNKQKYLLTLPANEHFAFTGLWNQWTEKSTGETLKAFTIITTEANALMSEIHNSKKRMPAIVANAEAWLHGEPLQMLNDALCGYKIA
jgi:putative SOS response-associated peptidase YedK